MHWLYIVMYLSSMHWLYIVMYLSIHALAVYSDVSIHPCSGHPCTGCFPITNMNGSLVINKMGFHKSSLKGNSIDGERLMVRGTLTEHRERQYNMWQACKLSLSNKMSEVLVSFCSSLQSSHNSSSKASSVLVCLPFPSAVCYRASHKSGLCLEDHNYICK